MHRDTLAFLDAHRAERVGPLTQLLASTMAAVALVKKVRRQNRSITEADLDAIRNVCRCGTYTRIRKAIRDGASRM